jgi:hypothetical protein
MTTEDLRRALNKMREAEIDREKEGYTEMVYTSLGFGWYNQKTNRCVLLTQNEEFHKNV